MLAGSPAASLARFTASTAAPSDEPGARLKESVTTGNWPWWLTVIGADWKSTWVNAESGTCPPVGNTVEVAMLPAVSELLGMADAAVLAVEPAPAIEVVDCGPVV